MIDHLGVPVSDYARSKKFYESALAPLGYKTLMEFGEAAGLGTDGKPDFWVAKGTPGSGVHFAILAENRSAVDAFYRAALAAGGKDNGAPGLRPQYHPTYYGAFVFDPDGNNREAVCHKPE
jgi:catechol 2,3-dioxygenase-like lactoylglutathione lyase family enzyme